MAVTGLEKTKIIYAKSKRNTFRGTLIVLFLNFFSVRVTFSAPVVASIESVTLDTSVETPSGV
jgi:hypothetical protein